MGRIDAPQTAPDAALQALETVSEICRARRISALDGRIAACLAFAREETLNVAVLGRFKAGKSSFLNHLLGRPLLPVGVIPVTAVVTELEYGPRDRAEVSRQDGGVEEVRLEDIGTFLSESENPRNCRQAARVRLELAAMARYRGIRFVDTPGLESVLEHNTETSLEWLPNVGLGLVAVGVDPPLSQHDLALIRELARYTPHISILLTKVDLLAEDDRRQVEGFVREQLARSCDRPIPVFPYSTRPGFETLRESLERELLSRTAARAGEERDAILRHKLRVLVDECGGYLDLARKAAEREESERRDVRRLILGEKRHLEETRQSLRGIAHRAAAASRAAFEKLLAKDDQALRDILERELASRFPGWRGSLRIALESFDLWLTEALARELAKLSERHGEEFTEPVRRVARQLSQSLQDFRNRLSERAVEVLGVPLRTSEIDLPVARPASPAVRVGRIFDRNWELLSALLPMWTIGGLVAGHFRLKTADAVVVNLSRLAWQWEEAVGACLVALEKEALQRLEALIATIDQLLESAAEEAPAIRADLDRLEELRVAIRAEGPVALPPPAP